MTDVVLMNGYVDDSQGCLVWPGMPRLAPRWVPEVKICNVENTLKNLQAGPVACLDWEIE